MRSRSGVFYPEMPRFIPFACALLMALSLPLSAAETVTKEQVLEAIRTFEANASGGPAARPAVERNSAVERASNTILKFSLESNDVVVDLGPDAVTWCDVKKGVSELSNSGERGLLLVAYLSGCVRTQLETGKQDPNPYAGWVAMLKTYRAVKMREGVTIPEAESLLARQANGTLEPFAAVAAQRSVDHLRKTYGPAEVPPKQQVASASDKQ